MALTSSISARASDWERIRCSTLEGLAEAALRGQPARALGHQVMPNQSAIAGRVATTSIQRHIAAGSPKLLPRKALKMKAATGR